MGTMEKELTISLKHMVIKTESLINTNKTLLNGLRTLPTGDVIQHPTHNKKPPHTKEELLGVLVARHALPSSSCLAEGNPIITRAFQKILNLYLTNAKEIDEKEQRVIATWLQLKQNHTIVMTIPFIESAIIKNLQISVLVNKNVVLDEVISIVTTLTHKYLVSPPNPRNSLSTLRSLPCIPTRKIMRLPSHNYRISPDAKRILEEYYNKFLDEDGKSYLPKDLYPTLEQLTGLPKKTIIIS